MTTYIERMEAEMEELDERARKLAAFIEENPIFATLTPFDQSLMVQQLTAMGSYMIALRIRVQRAKEAA